MHFATFSVLKIPAWVRARKTKHGAANATAHLRSAQTPTTVEWGIVTALRQVVEVSEGLIGRGQFCEPVYKAYKQELAQKMTRNGARAYLTVWPSLVFIYFHRYSLAA